MILIKKIDVEKHFAAKRAMRRNVQPAFAHAHCVCRNYLPRQCGIATFTTDLCTALATEYGSGTAVCHSGQRSGFKLRVSGASASGTGAGGSASYERAAEFLNFNGNDLVCLQHEYGIYGGVAGSHILTLLRKLKMPVVTTLHTVLREPDANQRMVLEEIARLSDRLVVMSEQAAQFLRECMRFRTKRSISFRTACPISSSWIPITSKTLRHRRQVRAADVRFAVAEQGN
jgi:hypothetical protein